MSLDASLVIENVSAWLRQYGIGVFYLNSVVSGAKEFAACVFMRFAGRALRAFSATWDYLFGARGTPYVK